MDNDFIVGIKICPSLEPVVKPFGLSIEEKGPK